MQASDAAMRAALIAQFTSTASTLEALVDRDIDPRSNGGMDITQRELDTLMRDADSAALSEISALRATTNFAGAPLLEGIDEPKVAHDVGTATLAAVLRAKHARIRLPEKASDHETSITRDAAEVAEGLANGYNWGFDDNARAIADIVAATPAYVERAGTRQGNLQARYSLMAVEKLIDRLAIDTTILETEAWRAQMEKVRDTLRAAIDKTSKPAM